MILRTHRTLFYDEQQVKILGSSRKKVSIIRMKDSRYQSLVCGRGSVMRVFAETAERAAELIQMWIGKYE